MTLEEIRTAAREKVAPKCKVCTVCDGRACKGMIPGPGAAGDGSSWTSCTDYLCRVKLNMDTIYADRGQDTTLSLFGRILKYPILIAPIGGMGMNYGGALTDRAFMQFAVEGANRSGILAFTGDGPVPSLFDDSIEVMKKWNGLSVPTFKPWANDRLMYQLKAVEKANGIAFAMDIDSAGFANMGSQLNCVSPKSVDDLKALTSEAKIPFILKGVMTVKAAEKAVEAGAFGIVVSTHGGRVIQSAPSTCKMAHEIRKEVGNKLKIIVDGGLRTGTDVFKALALGADAVMIGRPYAVAVIGGGADGVNIYTEQLGTELRNAMLMCGASSLSEICPDMISIE